MESVFHAVTHLPINHSSNQLLAYALTHLCIRSHFHSFKYSLNRSLIVLVTHFHWRSSWLTLSLIHHPTQATRHSLLHLHGHSYIYMLQLCGIWAVINTWYMCHTRRIVTLKWHMNISQHKTKCNFFKLNILLVLFTVFGKANLSLYWIIWLSTIP
jgi:hypothetical protein